MNVYYIVRRGTKYLHMSPSIEVTWGAKDGAFRFYSSEAALGIALTDDPNVDYDVVRCEGE